MADPLLSVAAARARIQQAFTPLAAETVALSAAAGRVLAEAIAARRTQPPTGSVPPMTSTTTSGLDARSSSTSSVQVPFTYTRRPRYWS